MQFIDRVALLEHRNGIRLKTADRNELAQSFNLYSNDREREDIQEVSERVRGKHTKCERVNERKVDIRKRKKIKSAIRIGRRRKITRSRIRGRVCCRNGSICPSIKRNWGKSVCFDFCSFFK